ncbi:hypothetical protein EXU57_24050 [Segetibacter sp. 3557_3]|uniref:hypothetical protein n=1 Tax=Segetibacter sp. 3557_3 TaxID=2547429 RepID=UPI001058BB73|nr:hypothetical protein [Segetibacter sp. 3557_3]TDH18254.1 hypothetical protein EXU57_24050 [Segetibacter sp. 3557_3]
MRNRFVLSAVGLGINAPAYGWPAGAGLRWNLPAGTFLRGEGVSSSEPKGWPNSYKIFRLPINSAAKMSCVYLNQLQSSSVLPLRLAAGMWIDFISRTGVATVGEQVTLAGFCTIHNDQPVLAMRFRLAPKTRRPAKFSCVAYSPDGLVITTSNVGFEVSTELFIDGPEIARLEIQLINSSIDEICVYELINDGQVLFSSPFIANLRPLTDPAEISRRLPPGHNGEGAELSRWITQTMSDPNALFVREGQGPSESGSPLNLRIPILDLLSVAALEPWMAQILGLLYWDRTIPATGKHIYGITAKWREEEYNWVLAPMSLRPPSPFLLPAGSTPYTEVLAPAPVITEDRLTARPSSTVVIRWPLLPSSTSNPTHLADHAVRYFVERSSAPSNLDSVARTAYFADLSHFAQIGPAVPATSPDEGRCIDMAVPNGFHVWRVIGLDLFNRPSLPVQTPESEVWDLLAPPPPSAVRGAFLSRAALPQVGSSSQDPFMTTAHAAWLREHSDINFGIYIGFDWPIVNASAIPDITHFKVYARASTSVVQVKSRIISVTTDLANGTAQVQLAPLNDTLRDSLVGGSLSDGKAVFEIVRSIASSSSFAVIVKMRQQPRHFVTVPDALLGRRLEGSSDAISYVAPEVRREATLTADLRDANSWGSPVAIVRFHQPLRTAIAAIIEEYKNPEPIIHLRLVDAISHPDPLNGVYLEGGSLYIENDSYSVFTVVTEGPNRHLPDGGIQVMVRWPLDRPLPRINEKAVYYPGYGVYHAYPSFRSGEEPVAYGLVTATAVRPGRGLASGFSELESATAPLANIVDVKRNQPVAPQITGPSLTGWPDAEGMSSYPLRWSPTANVRYVVFRALAEEVYEKDRALRRRLGDQYGQDELGATRDLLNLTLPREYPDPEHPDTPAYSRITNAALLQRIASLPGNAPAFVALSDTAVGIEDIGMRRTSETHETVITSLGPGFWYNESRREIIYVDRIPGVGRARYFYRLQAIDGAQNRSTLGIASVPVATRVERLPLQPALTEVRLGNRSVTLLWTHPVDNSVSRYAVFFARNQSELNCLELLRPEFVRRPHITLGSDADEDLQNPTSENAAWGWRGIELPAGAAAIGVVAERELENGIVLHSQIAVRQVEVLEQNPPNSPTIQSVERRGNTVNVNWITAEPWHDSLVEWRIEGEEQWRSVHGWLLASTPPTLSISVGSDDAIEVRIRSRNKVALSNPVRAYLPN